MHATVNFLGLFIRTGKIFFGLTRFSCLSVRMTDNFSASFGKSGAMFCCVYSLMICAIFCCVYFFMMCAMFCCVLLLYDVCYVLLCVTPLWCVLCVAVCYSFMMCAMQGSSKHQYVNKSEALCYHDDSLCFSDMTLSLNIYTKYMM